MLEGITHIFQIPLRWFQAVDAKCFHFTPGHMLRLERNDQGGDVLSVDREAFDAAVPSAETGTPAALGDWPTDEVEQTAGTLWEAGGDDGAEVMFAYRCAYENYAHKTYAAKLVISRDGLVQRIVKAENAGWSV